MRTVLFRPAFGSYYYLHYVAASTAFRIQDALCIIGYSQKQLDMTVRLAYRAYHIFHFVVLRYNFSGEPSYLKVLSIRKMENLAYIRILGRSEPFSALPAVVPPCVFGIIVIPVRITGLIDFSHLCLIALVFQTICVARC